MALCAAPWPARGAVLPEAEMRLYDAAFQHAEKSRYAEARAESAKGNHALLNKFFLWLDLSRSRGGGDVRELSAFLAANPHWPDLARVQRRAEKDLPGDLSDGEVLAWFDGRVPLTADGAVRLAEALRNSGQSEAAAALLRETWITADFTSNEEHNFRQRYGAVIGAGDETARLERLLERRAVAAARRQAKRLGGGYPALAEARLNLALDRAGVDAAIERVPAALHDDPGLLYERARWRQRRGRSDGVIELIDRAAATIHGSERWWPLRQWAARRALGDGEYATAYRMASGHGLEDGIGFAEAEWLAGWIALRYRDDGAKAQSHFTRLYDGVGSPISLARGAYWSAEAAAALGHEAEADGWYQRAAEHGTTFYGQLASARLGQPLRIDLQATNEVSASDRAAFEARELVHLVRLLALFDQRRQQAAFLRHLRGQAETASEFRLLAELSQSVDRLDQAVITAKQARRHGVFMPDFLYPLPEHIHQDIAQTPTPEPALVLAVIRQESAFDPKAISRAGARGLMQLMPATADQVARQLGATYQQAMLTENPKFNMRLGRAYLQEMLDEFGGAGILALAAYNAGPHRVVRWIRQNGDPRHAGVDPVDWIEQIPFEETRNYVQRVLEGQVVYRLALTGQRTVLPLDQTTTRLGLAP